MPTPLYVLAGQSNAQQTENARSIPDAIRALGIDADYLAVTEGGTGVAPSAARLDWYPIEDGRADTGELYQELKAAISAHLDANPDTYLAGVLWIQGEADTNINQYQNYEGRMEAFVSGLRDDFGDGFQFTISTLSENMPWYDDNEGQRGINEAQLRLAENDAKINVIDPDVILALNDIQPSDGLADWIHFNRDAADPIGRLFIESFTDGTFTGTGLNTTTTSAQQSSGLWRYETVVASEATGETLLVQTQTQVNRGDTIYHTIKNEYYQDGVVVREVLDDQNLEALKLGRHPSDGAYDWSRIEKTFSYETGEKVLVNLIRHQDDGRLITNDYDSETGVRIQSRHEDIGDIFAWDEVEFIFNTAGERTGKTTILDNGETIKESFDSDGGLDRRVTLDDKRYDFGELFEDGVRTQKILVDDHDSHSWDYISILYDTDGTTQLGLLRVQDDGRVIDRPEEPGAILDHGDLSYLDWIA